MSHINLAEEEWCKAKGAFHWKEFAEAFHLEKPAAARALGRGLLEGWLQMPWTMGNNMQVWFRHRDTKYARVSILRDASRREWPHLWPKPTASVRRRAGIPTEEQAAKRRQFNADVKRLAVLIRSCDAPPTATVLANLMDCGRDRVMRLLKYLEDNGIVSRSIAAPVGRGRPAYVWRMTKARKPKKGT